MGGAPGGEGVGRVARPPAEVRLRRLLAMLGWLARGDGAEIAELASRFGMSESEVVAELELAACCGLPPYTPDQLMELLVDGDRVQANLGPEMARSRRLSPAEGFSVAAAARAILAVPGSDPDGALAGALAKLESALGTREQVSVQLGEPELLSDVRDAVEHGRQLDITYYSFSRDETTERVVDPHRVFSSGGRWYLEAYCHRAGADRHFRVDRIEHVRPTGVDVPVRAGREGADVPDVVFEAGEATPMATVLIPEPARWLLDAVPVQSVTEESDGRLRVELAVSGGAWLARLLLRAGPGSSVVAPAVLAEEVAAYASAVWERHRRAGASTAP